MRAGDILGCIVVRSDESGLWVRSDGAIGLVDHRDVAWNPENSPMVGDGVRVCVRFLTPDADVPYDFVGSIKDAYPEKHPIHLIDDSVLGSRFVSRVIPMGRWWGLRHPTGLPALLPRETLDRADVARDEEIEVEVRGIDRERKRLLVRLPAG